MAQTTKDTIKQRILQAGEEAWLGEEGLAKSIVLAKDLASSAGMLRFFSLRPAGHAKCIQPRSKDTVPLSAVHVL